MLWKLFVTFFFFFFFFQVSCNAKAYTTNMEAVQAEVELSQRNRVVKGTAVNYVNNQTRFVQWCSVNRPAALNRAWVSVVHADVKGLPLGDGEPVPKLDQKYRKAVRDRLRNYSKLLSPMDYRNLNVEDGMIYLQQLDILASSKGVHRAAIRALFTDYGQLAPEDWDANLSILFAGIKRREAEKRQGGELQRTDGTKHKKGGKKPMTMQMYDSLSLCMYKQERTPFKILFIILCWNLMARACNVDNIGLHHLNWHDDAITVEFCHTKTNRTGSGKGLHPRHVYANPKRPQICPILALGVYLLVTAKGDGTKLFQSSREYDRVLKGLRTTIKDSASILEDLLGISAEEWGLHSLRKGSGSYATNGPCAVGKSISDNRGGWGQPGQGDVYYGYCPEGDQLIGRVLCGLSMGSVDFALLPPRFRDGVLGEPVRKAINILFPTYNDVSNPFPRILSFCLASVVYHSDWLLQTTTSTHPIRSCALFTDPELLKSLKQLVVCEVAQVGAEFQASGIPESICRLVQQQSQAQQLKTLAEAVHQNAADIVRSSDSLVRAVSEKIDAMGEHILKELDERQIESHLTPHGMRTVAADVMTDLLVKKNLTDLPRHLDELKSMIRNISVPVESAAPPPVVEPVNEQAQLNQGFCTYSWGGKIRLLPESFVLPTARHPPALMWNLYICGKPSEGIPPLQKVAPWNCPASSYRRYCEFIQLMKKIRLVVEESGAWTENYSAENAARMFEVGKVALESALNGPRPSEKAWTTVFKELRINSKDRRKKVRKRQQVQEDASGNEDDGEIGSFSDDEDLVPLRKRHN